MNLAKTKTSQVVDHVHQVIRKHLVFQLLENPVAQVRKMIDCLICHFMANEFLARRRSPPREQGGCGLGKDACEIDCEKGHKISFESDKIAGVLIIKNCGSKTFAKDNSSSRKVTKELTKLVNRYLTKKGVNVSVKVEFVKAVGDQSETQLHYAINVQKEHQDEIKEVLNVVCKEKEVR